MAARTGEIKEKGWEKVQIKAFTAWINNVLANRNLSIQDVKSDMSDGVRLINFLELLSNKKVTQKYDHKPPSRIQSIQNLHIALQFMEKHLEIKPTSSAEDFADQNLKMILGFLWSLFKKYRIQTIKQDDKSSEEGLLLWCKKTTEGYRDVAIESYRTSFRDGMAFLALCDKFIQNNDVLNFENMKKENAVDNLGNAFELAEKHLGIPKLLDPQEVTEGNVDERSLVLYISLYFHAFVAKQQQDALVADKEKIEARMRGLQGSLEDRARLATELQDENKKLRDELEELKNSFKHEQEAKNELQEKDTYLEEKVEVLKQLLEQENEEKEELEKAKRSMEKEIEELKAKVETVNEANLELTNTIDSVKKKTNEIAENKALLAEQVEGLQGQVNDLTAKLAQETESRKREGDDTTKRNRAETKGLEVLKLNLERHVEDLRRWQKYLDLDTQSELDFSGDIRPQILLDITKENFDDQVGYLAKKLDKENTELSNFLKAKEIEAKAKKSNDKKKKDKS